MDGWGKQGFMQTGDDDEAVVSMSVRPALSSVLGYGTTGKQFSVDPVVTTGRGRGADMLLDQADECALSSEPRFTS
jgi:hypothetical protein